MKRRPPNSPTHIHAMPNVPAGMKKAPIVTPMTIIYLMAQNPFWMGARGSFDEFAPIVMTAINVKKQTSAKQMR